MCCCAIFLFAWRAPGDVSFFIYDNNTFIVESFLSGSVDVRVSLNPKFSKIRDLITGEELSAQPGAQELPGGFGGFGAGGGKRLVCPLQIKPHSYRVFSVVQ